MISTLDRDTKPRAQREAEEAVRLAPKPYWNPYLTGVVLGFVLLAAFVIMGRGLGATGAYSSVLAAAMSTIAPGHAESNPVYWGYLEGGAPLKAWLVFLALGVLAGAVVSGALGNRIALKVEKGPRISPSRRLVYAFVGGAIAAWGAKIALGCTSGQGLSGGAMLSVGALVFLAAVFIAGFGLARVFRKEWL